MLKYINDKKDSKTTTIELFDFECYTYVYYVILCFLMKLGPFCSKHLCLRTIKTGFVRTAY